MAWLGMAKTAEEFAAGHPNHPFARPAIIFVPGRGSPSEALATPKASEEEAPRHHDRD
jgi:hypothetical protein